MHFPAKMSCLTTVVCLAIILTAVPAEPVSIGDVLQLVTATTGLDPHAQFKDNKDGLQHLYLHFLRAVHAHAALPYVVDTWGTSRGQLDRASIHAFLKTTSRHVKNASRYTLVDDMLSTWFSAGSPCRLLAGAGRRCLEWGVMYINSPDFSEKCTEKWTFDYSSGAPLIDPVNKVLQASLDTMSEHVLHSLQGYFDVIMCTQVCSSRIMSNGMCLVSKLVSKQGMCRRSP